jgi:hypothetical protein
MLTNCALEIIKKRTQYPRRLSGSSVSRLQAAPIKRTRYNEVQSYNLSRLTIFPGWYAGIILFSLREDAPRLVKKRDAMNHAAYRE